MKSSYFVIAVIIVIGLSITSLFTGVSHISLTALWSDADMRDIFFISRVPRTLALLLAGSAMSVAGLIMQLLTQNRFVEPSLVGTTQSASLGLLVVLVWFPSASIIVKMLTACAFALVGTLLFMLILRKIVLKSALIVPLVGIMLGSVISAITIFAAMHYDLLQSLGAWVNGGDFSGMLQGRYELLWVVGILTLLSCWVADSFTVAGMGREFAVNVGLNYRMVMLIGLSMIALVTGIVIVVVGALPFLGLIVPNLISLMMGDNIRKTIPWVCVSGGGLVLLCDIVGRVIRYPFEIPASTILGVIGAIIFLFLLIHQARYVKH
ncbi:iron complex transport system permease protein [Orbus hercynius]|uniref:Iron complex transport system permease protein n=1 Tax=Orbus hercynius TaxID=593135 RepID=A0A495RJM4_9GAMM|nr:iron chelate uptake ABC transporter family permease subunit [Orbus hercynius]RKS87645.1 iron complex transport system permease protein [Orbus hercynius]